MDGFDDGVNGYYDVDDQLWRYLQCRAEEHFAAERREKASLETRSDFEARGERVRETFLSAIGGLPDYDGDLSARMTGRVDLDGYSIERVIFESLPNFHVTANCYVPESNGPHPAVLFLGGHSGPVKLDWANQQACIDLALNGFVVLIVDPIGQGERKQYTNLDIEANVAGGGGTFPHIYAGQKCFYAGTNLARYMIHDARRGLEYLQQRPDVDVDRLGVTGTSGGGTQTIYLSLVDDRVDAVAPCCAVSQRREQLKTGKRTHAEEAITGSIAAGVDYDDLLAASAPRPLCIGAAAWDDYFPIEGVHETVDRVRRAYECFDAADRLNVVIGEENHCAVYDLRDGVFGWLCKTLGDDAYEPIGERPALDEAELQCTPEGSVLDAFADERTIDDLVREYVAETYPDAGTRPSSDQGDDPTETMRQTLVEKFNLDRERRDLHPRVVDESTVDGLVVRHVFFKTERDPDVVVTGVLVSDPEVDPDAPAVVLYERGTQELPDRSDDVARLAAEYGTVFVFDPRGVGAVRNRPLTVPPWWADDYYGIYGTECKFANDALLLGTSLLGMRAFDAWRTSAFLRSETGADDVTFVGEGVGATHALYAAALAEDVDRVDLYDLGPSFAERATGRAVPFHPQLTVFDVIEACDHQHLLAALEQRGVTVERPSRER